MRFIWLHGFASGPTSSKGQFVRARLEERGAHLAIPDLNEPAFFDLTVTRMLDQVDALAQGDGPLVLFGSSLGRFTAAAWAATRPRRRRGRGSSAERDGGRGLRADLPGIWRLIEPSVAPYLPQAPRPTP